MKYVLNLTDIEKEALRAAVYEASHQHRDKSIFTKELDVMLDQWAGSEVSFTKEQLRVALLWFMRVIENCELDNPHRASEYIQARDTILAKLAIDPNY